MLSANVIDCHTSYDDNNNNDNNNRFYSYTIIEINCLTDVVRDKKPGNIYPAIFNILFISIIYDTKGIWKVKNFYPKDIPSSVNL